MKEKYLNELKEALKFAFSYEDANTITNDYEELYDDYKASGLDDAEIIKKLGEPKDIVKSLIDENKKIFVVSSKRSVILPKSGRRKIIQALPIFSVIVYFILGFIFEQWHPGWLVFLLIPIFTVLLTPYKRNRLRSIAPFIAVIIFILVGTYVENGYYYSWIAFLLIPLLGILDS